MMAAASARKVRVVAKIRGCTDLESQSNNGVLLDASQTHISFSDQSASRKDCYQVDFCYAQNQGNHIIFTKEVKPLISGLFDGYNATIIASGPKGSGKTHMIQGENGEPGLATLAMAEILLLAPENISSITISLYEVDQDHVYDLLNPKRQQVFVFKDAQGKIQLKGLSQVPVSSMSEFQKFYGDGLTFRKPTQKTATEPPQRTHKGLIVYLSCHAEKLDSFPQAKINFVDLAGYEDSRRKSGNGLNLVENTKINKSIYALQNVVYSLNANESHVPYRESKLTHMLQDSLGGTRRILMITCLNPFLCQDSIYMVSLASRCCQGTVRPVLDSTKKNNSLGRDAASHKSQILRSVSNTVKKQPVPRVHFSGKKMNCSASSLKARKLFNEASHLNAEKARSSDMVSTIKFSLKEEEQLTLNVAKEVQTLEEDASLVVPGDLNSVSMVVQEDASLIVPEEVNSVSISVQEASPLAVSSVPNACENALPNKNDFLGREGNDEEVTASSKVLSLFEEDEENNSSQVNEGGSPPISARLQELSNNLKSLYYSTPSYKGMAPKNDKFQSQTSTNFAEPKTPEQSINVNDREVANFYSPWETFNTHSAGMKNSIVQEYLRLLNTAGKEDLKKLKGIGEKRATYILERREKFPEPFKNLDNLKDIGLSAKQIKEMVGKEVAGLFN